MHKYRLRRDYIICSIAEYSRAQGQRNCTIAARTSSVTQELLYLIPVFPKVLEMPSLVEGIDFNVINKRMVIIPITRVRTAIDPPASARTYGSEAIH